MRTLTIFIASFAAAAALVLPGCGDSGVDETAKGNESAESTPAKSVTVAMGEWFFRINHPRVKAGKVTVTAHNVGKIEHELIALKTDLAPDEIPMTAEGLDVDKAGELVIGEPHEHGSDEHMDASHSEDSDEHSEESAHEHSEESSEHTHGDDEHMDDADEHGDESDEHGDDEHMDGAGEEGHLEPGETRRYEVNLKPGKYVLLCSIPGHYEMGQYVGLVAVR